MSTRWIKPGECKSLAVLVETVIGQILLQHEAPICLELDIDTDIDVPANAEQVVQLLSSLVAQSLEEMEGGGDLTKTAFAHHPVDNPHGFRSGRSLKTFAYDRCIDGSCLSWYCPQGGGAVTIIFPRQSQNRRAAA